jgi:hypothetical protein
MGISANIKALIKLQGKRQSDIYKFFGISERQWRNWMKFPEQYLTLGRMVIIANLLHVTVTELLER